MNLYDQKAKLTYAAKKLHIRWADAQAEWHDPVSNDFERQYLTAIEPPLLAAVRAMDQISELLARVEHECR